MTLRSFLAIVFGLTLAACDQSNTPGKLDTGTGKHLKITYQGTDHQVDLSTLTPTVNPAGAAAVLLSDAVRKALPGKDLARLSVNFRGAEGYDPATKSTCVGTIPVPGKNLSKGFVDLATVNLSWATDLQYPGCVHVKGLAQLILADAVASDAGPDRAISSDRGGDRAAAVDRRTIDLATPVPGNVRVYYKGSDTLVDVSKVTKVTPDSGTAYVLLSEIVLKALPGKDLATLNAHFIGAGGYDPATKSNCNGYLPVPGDKLSKGQVDPSTLTLTWETSLKFPGCLKVTGLEQVLLTDK